MQYDAMSHIISDATTEAIANAVFNSGCVTRSGNLHPTNLPTLTAHATEQQTAKRERNDIIGLKDRQGLERSYLDNSSLI